MYRPQAMDAQDDDDNQWKDEEVVNVLAEFEDGVIGDPVTLFCSDDEQQHEFVLMNPVDDVAMVHIDGVPYLGHYEELSGDCLLFDTPLRENASNTLLPAGSPVHFVDRKLILTRVSMLPKKKQT